jgi:hypothetical protein
VPRSHAEEIVEDYFDADEWDALIDEVEPEPDLDLPPLPPPRPTD